MPYERIIGLQVKDRELYQLYREAMRGLLEAHGGGFRYDFWIQETLASATAEPINRVFAIYFPDQASQDRFFSHPEYLRIRAQFFEPAVAAVTMIAAYERDPATGEKA